MDKPERLKYIIVNHRKNGTRYTVSKTFGKGEKRVTYNYGIFDDLNEAMKVRDRMKNSGWPEPVNSRPLRYIRCRGPQSYNIFRKQVNYGNYPTLDYAQYVRDELEACNWDKSQLPRIKDGYPEYYTRAMMFYKDIIHTDTDHPWKVRDYKLVNNKINFELIATCSTLEEALWERDLYYEYGDDIQSLAEDTRPNPYENMKLPYWPSRRQSGAPVMPESYFKNILKEYIDGVKAGADTLKKLSELLNISQQTIQNNLGRYDLRFLEFKRMIRDGINPLDIVGEPEITILEPDTKIYASKNNNVHRHGPYYQITKGKVYYGSYKDRDVAERIAKGLEACGWDKSQLKRIQDESGLNRPNNIYKTEYGWAVRKKMKNKKIGNYGHYTDRRVAILVRDLLIKYDWNKEYLPRIRDFAEYCISMVDNCYKCR